MLIIGSGAGARWKAELVRAAGAQVEILSPVRCEALHDVDATVIHRGWRAEDMVGAALVFAAPVDAHDAAAIRDAARAVGVPVNIIDHPDYCDFQTGTIINRFPVTIGVSTDGAAPILGQALRTRIETVLPRGLGAWAALAKRWRPWAKTSLPEPQRRRFWQALAERAFDTEPDASLRDTLASRPTGTRVFLVGAGPGDPDLLTLRAARILQQATVILHDALVDPRILEMARREARRIAVGKRGGQASVPQAEISNLIVELAQAGETVVRLKGGDPMVFGRATEELTACAAHGIAVEVVPGITAASAAASALQISLTERGVARRVQFVTGQGSDGKLPADIDWRAIADADATTVLYMGRKTIAAFVTRAMTSGLSPSTPAVAIAAVSCADETTVPATLSSLPRAVAELDPALPLVVILGRVARTIAAQADASEQQELVA